MLNRNQRRISHKPHDVYKAFDALGDLLYVGISVNVFTRLRDHNKYATWMRFATSIDVVQYPDRSAARAEEARSIREDEPLFNVTRENAFGCELSDDVVEAFTLRRDENGWYIEDDEG